MITAFENFAVNCPSFVQNEVKSGLVEIVQLVEFDLFFALLTYEKETNTYHYGTTSKVVSEEFAKDIYTEHKPFLQFGVSARTSANKKFLELLDDLT